MVAAVVGLVKHKLHQSPDSVVVAAVKVTLELKPVLAVKAA